MEVRPGYERIEGSEIPEGWEINLLGDICATSSGTTPSRESEDRYYKNGTTHWVKTADLTNSDIFETEELITETALHETSLRVYPVGTVLVAMYGGFNQIGRTGLLRIPAAVNQAITAIQPNTKILDSVYLINTLNFRVAYWKNVASSSRKDPNITGQDIRDFSISLPPLPEQRVIAEVLSDMDALIAALDRLIAKKRAIKQSAMQRLLTGQTRLPGFGKSSVEYKQTEVGAIPDDWKACKVGDLSNYITVGFVGSMAHLFVDEGIPLLRGKNILPHSLNLDDLKYISIETHRQWRKSALLPGDVVIVRVGYPGTACVIPEHPGELNAASLVVVRPNHDLLDSDFLCAVLNSSWGKAQIQARLVGGAQQVFNTRTAADFTIPLPTPPEQHAIAAVLSDMDAEIAMLEARREKTRALKQGMMQELLTGKTRLV